MIEHDPTKERMGPQAPDFKLEDLDIANIAEGLMKIEEYLNIKRFTEPGEVEGASEMDTYLNAAEVEYCEDDLKMAGDFAHNALSLAGPCGKDDGLYELALVVLGKIYSAKGDMKKAGECCDELEGLMQNSNDTLRVASICEGIGEIMIFAEDFDEAHEYYMDAYEGYKKAEESKGMLRTIHVIRILYEILEEPSELLDCCETNLELLQKAGRGGEAAGMLIQMAGICEDIEDFDRAAECYRKAYESAKEHGNSSEQGTALLGLGNLALWDYDIEKSLGYHLKAQECFHDAGERKLESGCMMLSGNSYALLEDPGNALRCLDNALEIKKKIDGYLDVGDFLFETGTFLLARKYEKLSIRYFDEGMALALAHDEEELEQKFNIGLGNAYNMAKEWHKAIDYHSKAFEWYDAKGDTERVGLLLRSIEGAYMDMGEYDKAIGKCEEHLRRIEGCGDPHDEGECHWIMGCAYREKEQYDRALECFDTSRAIASGNRSMVDLADMYLDIGLTYIRLEDYKKAIVAFRNALDIFKKEKIRDSETYALEGLGSSYAKIHEYGNALKHYEALLKIYKKAGMHNGIANVLHSMAMAYSGANKMKKALEHIDSSRSKFETLGDSEGIVKCLNAKGGMLESMGKEKKAKECYKKASLIINNTGNGKSA